MDIVREFEPEHLAYWSEYDREVVTFGPPEGLVAVEPALAIVTPPVEPYDLGVPCVRVAWKPNEIDLAYLARGGTIWLSIWGRLPPHVLEVQAPGDSRHDDRIMGR